MGNQKKYLACFIFSTIFLSPKLSWAYGMDDFEFTHALSVGAGIADPSITTALIENPAGLANNFQTKFLAEAGSGSTNLNPMGLGGHFYLGNGFVGGAIGAQNFVNRGGNSTGEITLLNFGLGTEISSLNIALGVAASYVISNTGDTATTGTDNSLNLNVGMIYNPKGDVKVGVTAFHLLNTLQALGAGISADANQWATFALDGSVTPQGHGATLKPGMGIHLMDFQLSFGYGIGVDDQATSWIPRGSSFAVGVTLSHSVQFQFYYNEIALYYAGLTFRM